MATKKLLFIVVLIAIAAVGWLGAVNSLSNTEEVEAQAALVVEADALAEKELYVRAIPLYLEALGYSTESNDDIELKLLDAYLGYGKTSEYTSLVEKRAASNKAAEDEYLTAVELYLSGGDVDSAAALLRLGISNTGSEALMECYDQYCYPYDMRNTNYVEIIPTATNSIMAAYNGVEWQYINSSGRVAIPGEYEAATSFSDGGFAAVKADGQYYLITTDGSKYGVDETGLEAVSGVANYVIGQKDGKYGYYTADFSLASSGLQFDIITLNANGRVLVSDGGKWAIITDSGEKISDFVYDSVAINSIGQAYAGGVAMLCEGGAWYIVSTDGEKLSATGFADARAPESGGYIAVSNGTNFGFVDQSGNVKLDYTYEDAKSFSEGLAPVKIDGRWGYINERGSLVIDAIFDDAQPFRNGIAIATFNGYAAILTLDDIG